jgi:hypothetical protein
MKCASFENKLAMKISGPLKVEIREKVWILNKKKQLLL